MRLPPSRETWFQGDLVTCQRPNVPRDRHYRLVLLGPPGVGKGTQAELLCREIGTCHLSTGDLFRAGQAASDPTPAMATAVQAMRRGELVSDELVMEMVRERSTCLRCGGGFLLDGVPRTVAQAESLESAMQNLGVSLDAVISYELPVEEIVDRLAGRRSCANCKAVYHIDSKPPRTPGVCDHCQANLVQREDDRAETVRVRMQAFAQATQPLVEFYDQRQQLVPVDAHGTPEQILAQTLTALQNHLGVQQL